MRFLALLVQLVLAADIDGGQVDDSGPVDALWPEHVRVAVKQLDDPNFQRREDAELSLYSLGFYAIFPLSDSLTTLSPEAQVRVFEILQQLYRREDQRTYEAAERAFRHLMHIENLAVTSRAERAFNSLTELRQTRGIAKFIQLGGLIKYENTNAERHAFGATKIEYIMIGPNWTGGDEGLQLIENVQEVHLIPVNLIVIRDTKISNEALLDLRSQLPFLLIQRRGPCQLGVGSNRNGNGCMVDNIKPGSSADRAGLQPHDQILEIDGEQIDDFESLVKVIEKKEPGNRVPVVFLRDFKIQKVEVELLPWDYEPAAKAVPAKP